MLSNRSKLFLRKVKAQQGMQVPYIDPNQDQLMDYYSMQAPANIEQNLQPNFQAAQNQALRGITKTSGNMSGIQMPTQQRGTGLGNFTDALGNVQERKGSYEISEKIGEMNIPFLSNWTKSVVGMYDFFESFKDKKKQKAFEKSSQADLKVRKEQARSNSFYATPYTLGRSDNFASGGTVPKKFQMGGSTQMDLFMDYYNQQQQASKDSVNQLQETYENRNKQLENEWETRKSQGFAQWQGAGAASFGEYMKYFGGGMGGGGGMMQQGGIIPIDTMRQESTASPVNLKAGKYSMPKQNPFMEGLNEVGEMMVNNVPGLKQFEYKPIEIHYSDDTPTLPAGYTERDRKRINMLRQGADPDKIRKKMSKVPRYHEKQEGGEIDQTEQGMNPTEDLYSDQFQSPYEQDTDATQELENKVYSENPDVKYQNNSGLMQWLMQEEPLQTYTVSDLYTGMYGGQQQSEELPIQPVVSEFEKLGIGIGSINTGTHNTNSKHYHGKAFDIPGSKNGGREGLYKIYNYLNSPEGKTKFPNIKVINEIDKPAGKVGDANHLHIEIND